MRWSVVIVNWNAGRALAACIGSIERAPEGEIILVDNASSDGSVDEVAQRFPDVRVLRNADNLGFAAGVNRGVTLATGGVVVLLNPDARCEAGAVDRLVAALEQDPAAAIAGGGLRDVRGGWQPASAHFGPLDHIVRDTALGRRRLREATTARCVDWVYGTFMAVRRAAFLAVGGFDERYFCYGEDLDLCWRVTQRGARILWVPGAAVVHGDNVSATLRFGRARDAEVVKGELRFYAWRQGRWAAARYRAGVALKAALKLALAHFGAGADAVATQRAILDVCRRFRP